MKKINSRDIIKKIHLWLGLISGIVLFIVCFTGTIYTFRTEIELWINPDKFYVNEIGNKKSSLQEVINQVEKEKSGKVSSLFIHENEKRNYEISINKKSSEKGNQTELIYFDPYNNKIVAEKENNSSRFFIFIMKAHRWLLLDPMIGRPIVGIATLIFIALCISGLILWLPKKFKQFKKWKYWKPGFKIKLKGWKRANYDIHNTLGFYSLIPLLIMALTGLCWSFEWYRNGVSELMGHKVFEYRTQKPEKINFNNTQPLAIDQIIDISNNVLPYKGNYSILIPKDLDNSYTIIRTKNGFFTPSTFDRIEMDPYNASVVKLEKFSDRSLSNKVVTLIRSIHLGNIFGTFSKIIYFITCLIATSLPITGTIIWLNRLKKKKGSPN